MKTPIVDFVKQYKDSGMTRLHMPGHKGKSFLGFEEYDITEIKGADALYEAEGIIRTSEKNATELFGSRRTLYSTEGSSQCIRGMLYLMLVHYRQKVTDTQERDKEKRQSFLSQKSDKLTNVEASSSHNTEAADCCFTEVSNYYNIIQKRPKIIAARNVHKVFIFAATLLDFDILWLWPETHDSAASICSCIITPQQVEETLKKYPGEIAGVYLTSPDYLGGESDIAEIAKLCHKYDTVLAVDNAHGAYLHFLKDDLEQQEKVIRDESLLSAEKAIRDEKSISVKNGLWNHNKHTHPLDAGADICCDSAHKTLPVLTGGAYLHIGKNAPACFDKQAKYAMALFGSTSPSYLILASLDQCNRYLAESYKEKLQETTIAIESCKKQLAQKKWHILDSDPLKITIEIPKDMSSEEKAEELRKKGIECEYADPDYLVFMITPENDKKDLEALVKAMGENPVPYEPKNPLPVAKAEQILSIREAMFSDYEEIPVEEALGRICRVPAVSCPPAIPIVVPGERIEREAIELFHYYGMKKLDVVRL